MFTTFRKRWEKFNFRQFLIFLGVALLLWVSVQLSLEQDFKIESQLKLTEFPKDVSVPLTTVSVELLYNGNGFSFIKNVFNWKNFEISVRELQDSSGIYFFSEKILLQALERTKKNTSNSLAIKSLPSPIYYKKYYSKYIPICSRVDFQFASSFTSFEGVQLSLDSVKVIGSQESLEKTAYVYTEKRSFNNLSKSFKDKVFLASSKEYGHMLENDEVEFSIVVQQFSEERVSIPIQVSNMPEKASIFLSPDFVKLYYKVSLDDIDSVSALDFKVEVDFSITALNYKQLPLVVTKKAARVKDVRIEPSEVFYLYTID